MIDAVRTGWPAVTGNSGRRLPAPGDLRKQTAGPRARLEVPGLSLGYLAVLLVLVLLRSTSPRVVAALVRGSTTDVWHLLHDPVVVLLASALWLPASRWWLDTAVLTVVLPVLERRVGWRQTAAVFVSGHVLATLLTELPVGLAVALGWSPAAAVHRLDVGVSYGMAAVVAACLVLLPRRARQVGVAVAACLVLVPLVTAHDMTAVGHALSLAIGRIWWTSLARRVDATPFDLGAARA